MTTPNRRLPSEDEIRDLSIVRALELVMSTDWQILLDRPDRHQARMALRNLLAYDSDEVVAAAARSALGSSRSEYVIELCAAVAEEGPETADLIRVAVLAARRDFGLPVADWVDEVISQRSPAARAGARVVKGWLTGSSPCS